GPGSRGLYDPIAEAVAPRTAAHEPGALPRRAAIQAAPSRLLRTDVSRLAGAGPRFALRIPPQIVARRADRGQELREHLRPDPPRRRHGRSPVDSAHRHGHRSIPGDVRDLSLAAPFERHQVGHQPGHCQFRAYLITGSLTAAL